MSFAGFGFYFCCTYNKAVVVPCFEFHLKSMACNILRDLAERAREVSVTVYPVKCYRWMGEVAVWLGNSFQVTLGSPDCWQRFEARPGCRGAEALVISSAALASQRHGLRHQHRFVDGLASFAGSTGCRTYCLVHGVGQELQAWQIIILQYLKRHSGSVGADVDRAEQVAIAGEYRGCHRAQT